jgi:hypothetical protein
MPFALKLLRALIDDVRLHHHQMSLNERRAPKYRDTLPLPLPVPIECTTQSDLTLADLIDTADSLTTNDIDAYLRHSNAPFAYYEYRRSQIERAQLDEHSAA